MIYLYFILKEPLDVKRNLWPIVFTRGLFGFLGQSFSFLALIMLTIGEATVLAFLSPLLTSILAFFFLGETLQLFDALSSFLSLTGVVVVAKPSFLFPPDSGTGSASTDFPDGDIEGSVNQQNGLRLLGILMAFLGALMSAFVFILIRKSNNQVKPIHFVLSFNFVSVLCCILVYLIVPNDKVFNQTWVIYF